MDNEKLWQAVLAQIQLNISEANFATWFRDAGVHSQKGGEITISVPNTFVKEWLEQKYNKLIFKVLRELDGGIRKISYLVDHSRQAPLERIRKEAKISQLEFQELNIDKGTGLNPRYTFENFVVGPFNELPQAAAWAAAENPGNVYNPLFVYGGVGLGKTHLLQAIGNKVAKNLSSKRIKYIPSVKFTSGMVTAIRNQTIEAFKETFKAIDVLIVDDVQFMAGKEKSQEEFFHIFNFLYNDNKQIVLSSDHPPKAIPALAERLRSRFEGGMIADIGYPDFETRLAILKSKAQDKEIEIPDEVLSFVASKIQRNIRELEGALNRLIAHRDLNKEALTLETAQPLLKSLIHRPVGRTTPEKIIKTIGDFYSLKKEDLKSPSRKKEFVRPRQIAAYLLKKMLNCSYPAIGRRLGGRDHTTAIHAYRKISEGLKTDNQLEEEIELIKERIFSV